MKFDLNGQGTAPVSGTTPGGTADGNFELAPEVVIAILNKVQTMATEFNDTFGGRADDGGRGCSGRCHSHVSNPTFPSVSHMMPLCSSVR